MENIEIVEKERYCSECGEPLGENEFYVCNFCRREIKKREEEQGDEDD